MNILLILFNKDIENLNILNDRIQALGDTFYIYDNVVFLETEESTKNIYEKISKNEFEKSSMIVLYVTNEELGFWGRMNIKLWKWLNEKVESSNTKGLTLNYIHELQDLTEKNLDLNKKNNELKKQIADKDKVIENLYQQNLIYTKKQDE